MDNRLITRLLGEFAPSRGDLAFSQMGELLGIMVSNSYCVIVDNFLFTRTIRTGDEVRPQETGRIVDELVARYRRLPFRVQ